MNGYAPEYAVDISKEDAVNIIGDTDLTEGQVKRMINERKVIIAHFLDRGDEWHCFFITYNSIGGKENHKDGQPHFHYISSAFGIKRDDFIKSMESGNYKSTSGLSQPLVDNESIVKRIGFFAKAGISFEAFGPTGRFYVLISRSSVFVVLGWFCQTNFSHGFLLAEPLRPRFDVVKL